MNSMQKRLLSETKLTFEDALKSVSSMEATTKSAVELQAGEKRCTRLRVQTSKTR